MKTGCGWARSLLVIFSLAMLALIAVAALLWSTLPWPAATVTVDGQSVSIAGLAGWHAALALLGAALAVLIGLVVASLAVVFGIGVAVLAVAVAVLAVLASLAFLVSPVLVAGWLLWRLTRPRPAPVVTA